MKGTIQRNVCSSKVVAHEVRFRSQSRIKLLQREFSDNIQLVYSNKRTFVADDLAMSPFATFEIQSVTSALSLSDTP